MSVSARNCAWFIAGLGALLVLAGLAFSPPRLSVDHSPQNLATEPGSHGFFGPETDGTGNRFVWTEPRASTTFADVGRRPVTLHLMLRSAAVADGPDAPIRLIVNGREVGQLRPDPGGLAFQPFRIDLPRVAHGALTVELAAEPFRPGKGDRRTLGTMVQGIEIDRYAAWSLMAEHYWLYYALVPLAALVASFALIARRTAIAGLPLRMCSARCGYAAVIACAVAAACMLAAATILLQIGRIDGTRSLGWLLGSVYLGCFCVAAAAHLPWGKPDSPSLRARLERARFVARHRRLMVIGRDATLFALGAALALHFLKSPGTGDVQDKLRWMHSMAADGLVRGFQESRDDYPPGTYIVLFGAAKLAPHLGMGFFMAYKVSLLLFLALSGAAFLLWTRNGAVIAAMLLTLVVGSVALGYNDVYFIPFLLVALWALRGRKLVWFSILITVTCLMKWQPAVLVPVFLLHLFATIRREEGTKRTVTGMACRVALPAVAILAGALLAFGGEFLRELHRATSENFLSANALNVDWIATRALAWWNPQRFDFGQDTHRHFIRVSNSSILTLLKVPFAAVYAVILARFAKEPESFLTAIHVAYLGYLAYFLLNTSVHENHLVPAIVLAGLLATYERRHLSLFAVTAIVANTNMILFYGLDGVPRLPVLVRGIDFSLVLAAINVGLFALVVTTYRRTAPGASRKDVLTSAPSSVYAPGRAS